MTRSVLGLTGGMCSGKDSWADLFESEFGYARRTTSDIVRAYINDQELGEPTRDLTREVATELRKQHGLDYLARMAIAEVGDGVPVILSGLYVVPEAEYVRSLGGSIVNVAASEDLKFARMSNRKRAGEAANVAEYRRLVQNDLNSETTDQRLEDVIGMADYEIDGDVPIADLDRCRKIAADILMKIESRKNYV